MKVKLRLTGTQYEILRQHLLPTDRNEAIAFALCGRLNCDDVHALCVRQLSLIPHNECIARREDLVSWRTERLFPLLDSAANDGSAIVKFHSHPGGLADFSPTDDSSDYEILSAAQYWTDSILPHGSVVMLPDGQLFGRWIGQDQTFQPIEAISVSGTDIHFWPGPGGNAASQFLERVAQAFGQGTTALLSRLTIAVIGCSGTGSLVVDQLVRNGVGRLILVDPDRIEAKNLNRISFARRRDIGQYKTEVAMRWIHSLDLETSVESVTTSLCDSRAVKRVASADIVIGCMDGAEGRFLLNKLASYYCLPYFDVGVRLDSDGHGGVNQICGTVHYLQPGGSSLLSRGAITMAAVQAEGLKRTNPEEFSFQAAAKYIHGVNEERPAVISVNMHYASMLVLELLARLHPYRVDGNKDFSQYGSSLTDPRFEPIKPDGDTCRILNKHVGRGDVVPLLDCPYLSGAGAA